MSHAAQPTILLIETDIALRRLITLGLQYQGVHVLEAISPTTLPAIETQAPNILILDIDSRGSSNWSLLTTIQTHPYLSTLPVIVLTWECCPLPISTTSDQPGPLPAQIICLPKPFDARALHDTIEQLFLATTLQEKLPENLVAQTATPAPSIWPLTTAIGLLIAFIGLMGPLAITALGLLIVIMSLLWWTVGTGTKKERVSVSM